MKTAAEKQKGNENKPSGYCHGARDDANELLSLLTAQSGF